MPLASAEADASFVAEVSGEIRTSCTRMNEQVSSMIEEYLRRRIESVRQEVQQQCDVQLEQMKLRLESIEGEKSVVEGQHASVKHQLAEAAELLRVRCSRTRMLGCFLSWKRDAERRREQRCLAAQSNQRRERLAAFHCYCQWRLFSAARRSAHLEAAALHARDCREQDLQEELKNSQIMLRDEQEKNAKLSEDLKEAFVRGMCALNREAVQVLHGSSETQDGDVEAIAEILSRDGHSRRQSAAPANAEDSMQSIGQRSSICPVHQVDRSGHFYHRCFAPGHCDYADHCPRSRTPPSSDVSPAPPAPFIVRADPQSVRSFNAESSVSLRQNSRSSQARWKI